MNFALRIKRSDVITPSSSINYSTSATNSSAGNIYLAGTTRSWGHLVAHDELRSIMSLAQRFLRSGIADSIEVYPTAADYDPELSDQARLLLDALEGRSKR